ncbi:hypothetical protein L1987_64707 [Smallanthus sonchifolius]|uniref:Uncharacterized protein n=1 Tax=Smallanthus sonchifolius TaxID=185202 RepID=A0ACB9BSC0_9ASTR|nr:hypothetical protein L1987_64707 [Smallanthus sonchifolius]
MELPASSLHPELLRRRRLKPSYVVPSSSFPPEFSASFGDFEDEVKEQEHYSLQEKLDNEIKELEKRLENHNKLRKV